jgi:hypothetical protein
MRNSRSNALLVKVSTPISLILGAPKAVHFVLTLAPDEFCIVCILNLLDYASH